MTYRTLLAACAITALTSSAFAAVPLLPPKKYDYTPNTEIIYRLDQRTVWEECSRGGKDSHIKRNVAGCSHTDTDGRCVIYVAMKTWRADPEKIIRHERAHCNSWPRDHSMGGGE